ncbi:septum formation initiator family protein [Pseudarthrobacter sp. IC2-21]|uniref:FtsB family cell division protein n=1 Tax=Pseudarthrobacter sp. IC2-21 TaxID=3092262 RepID=UPI002A6ADE06|nr:septum formation initiator family protein [Pseudarthrobacter sp. IC2-21]
MATRRPKVPKAASPQRGTADRPQEAAADTADVIRAQFGGTKGGAAAGTAGRPAGAAAHPGASSRAPGATKGTPATGAPSKGTSSKGTSPKGTSAKGRPGTKVRGSSGSGPGGTPKGEEAEETQPVPAKAFSGRMLALAVVMIAITIMLAPTVKIFFDKRAELTALSDDIAARQAEGDRLRQQISRWQDPNYVKQQARDRINMVMPGETGYWVFGSDLPAGSSSSQNAAAAQDPADLPWVDSLWESVRRAATD